MSKQYIEIPARAHGGAKLKAECFSTRKENGQTITGAFMVHDEDGCTIYCDKCACVDRCATNKRIFGTENIKADENYIKYLKKYPARKKETLFGLPVYEKPDIEPIEEIPDCNNCIYGSIFVNEYPCNQCIGYDAVVPGAVNHFTPH